MERSDSPPPVDIHFLVKRTMGDYFEAFSKIRIPLTTVEFITQGHLKFHEWNSSRSSILIQIFKNYSKLMTHIADKSYMFQSLTRNDQMLLLENNEDMFSMYIIARYFTQFFGIDQLSTIFGPISPLIGKSTLDSLFYNTVKWSIKYVIDNISQHDELETNLRKIPHRNGIWGLEANSM